jgi:Lrp/AsnC family transcriptional regulator, regulator for asnA, asnC and gidA
MNPPRRPSLQIDETDRLIIEQLQGDGRMPYTKLGTQVGLSEAAVRQRVQRLTDAGVIQIVAVSDPMLLGRRRIAMIGVRTEGDVTDISEQIAAIPDAEYVVITAGSFDIMVEAMAADEADLLRITNLIRTIPGVRSTETFMLLHIAKQTFNWGAH